MDAVLSKKTALKRRASFTLLFGSQKPTFAVPVDERPTRYYEFADTPIPTKFQSPFISRQEISPELESKVRHACSLLAYRIEQGIPSPPDYQATCRGVREKPVGKRTITPELASKYPTSKAEVPAFVTGYDSGVGLTQQPSMQTMRVLHSHSGHESDSGDTTTGSVFNNTRTGTSCSSAIKTTELSCTQSSSHSPKQDELHSMTGVSITADPQDTATKAFLTETSSEAPPYKAKTKEKKNAHTSNDSDVGIFLNPPSTAITNLSCETLSTQPSPSLGLSRVSAITQYQHQQPAFTSDPESGLEDNSKTRNIIIDSTGRARLLTSDEESHRNKVLQQAVIAKMTPGFMKYNPAPRRQERLHGTVNSTNRNRSHNDNSQARPPSRLGLARSGIKSDFDALKRKDRIQNKTTCFQKLKDGKPRFGKISRFFSRERSE
ncbi:uncharacterized protein BDV17DRAFT_272148 [Aspergillus undulatus]|uniref:uncharacterized protein n=1 Tax=Aspergillus undulatus TaxID=1810928 RepID=UPI003CCD45D8